FASGGRPRRTASACASACRYPAGNASRSDSRPMPLVQVLSPRYRVAIWVGSALAAAGLASFAAYALAGLGRGSLDNLFLLWVNSGISFAAATICAARGLAVRHERRAWTLLGFAIASSATGDLIY